MHTSSTTQSFSQEQIFYCSFCSKSNKQVRQLISGPNDVYICDECVDIAHQIVQERRARQGGADE